MYNIIIFTISDFTCAMPDKLCQQFSVLGRKSQERSNQRSASIRIATADKSCLM